MSVPALSAARSALAAYVGSCYCGWSDASVAAEPAGPAFLALRSALAAGSADWPALAAPFLADAFPGFSDEELAECAPEFLAARSALAGLSRAVPAPAAEVWLPEDFAVAPAPAPVPAPADPWSV